MTSAPGKRRTLCAAPTPKRRPAGFRPFRARRISSSLSAIGCCLQSRPRRRRRHHPRKRRLKTRSSPSHSHLLNNRASNSHPLPFQRKIPWPGCNFLSLLLWPRPRSPQPWDLLPRILHPSPLPVKTPPLLPRVLPRHRPLGSRFFLGEARRGRILRRALRPPVSG